MARYGEDHVYTFELALKVLKPGVNITPAELNEKIGRAPLAPQTICFLRKYGHYIESNRDSRTVISYTYVNGPTAAETRAAFEANKAAGTKPKAGKPAKPAAKVEKPATIKAAAKKKADEPKKDVVSKKADVPKKTTPKKSRKASEVPEKATESREQQVEAVTKQETKPATEPEIKPVTEPVAQPVASTIDPDWDNTDDLDVRNLF